MFMARRVGASSDSRPLRRSTWRIINRSRKSRQRVKTSCDNPVIIDVVVHRILVAGCYRCCRLFSAVLLAFGVNTGRERDENQVVTSSPTQPRWPENMMFWKAKNCGDFISLFLARGRVRRRRHHTLRHHQQGATLEMADPVIHDYTSLLGISSSRSTREGADAEGLGTST